MMLPPRLRGALVAYAIPALAFFVVVLAVNWRLWTGIDGARRAYNWDALWAYWGYYDFQLDSWGRGELPLWCPWDRAGYPFHADPQPGVLYPGTWLVLLLGAFTGAKYWLVTVVVLLHAWLGGVGMYAFLRHRGVPRFACYAGGIFFILTYPWTHAMWTAINWGMAWAPWMLLAVDWWAERPTTGRGAAVALSFAMCQLAGAPAAFWYSLIVVVPYGVWAIAHHRGRATDARAYLVTAARTAAIAGALFIAMVAAQLGATSALVTHTVREARDMAFIGVTAFSADDIMGMAVPRLPGEGAYLTIVAIFAIAAQVSLRPAARSYVLLGVAVAGGLLALGDQTGFLANLASTITPFSFFRRAHRYLYVAMVPLAILAAEGLAALAAVESDETRRRARRLLLAAGAMGVTIFGSAFVLKSGKPNMPEPFRDAYGWAVLSFVVSTWVLVMLLSVRDRWRIAFGWFAAVVLFMDLWAARFPVTEKNFQPIPEARADAKARTLAGVPLEARIYDREYFKYRPGIRLEVRDLGGYEGDPLALSRYDALLKRAQGAPALLGHANVRWLTEGPTSYTKPKMMPAGGLKAAGGGIHEVPVVAPAVLWTARTELVPDAKAAVAALARHAPGSVAVLEEDSLGAGERERIAAFAPDAPPVAGRFARFAANRVTVEIDAPAEGVVVIHEAYYPGWKARVDGQPAKILPANGAFRGVLVGPGPHVIELWYPATGYKLGALCSLLALLASVALFGRDVLSRRRKEGTTP